MFLTPLDYVLQVLWYETKNRHLILYTSTDQCRFGSVNLYLRLHWSRLTRIGVDFWRPLHSEILYRLVLYSHLYSYTGKTLIFYHSYMIRIKKPNPFLKLDSLLFSVFDYHNREVGFALANDWEFPYSARNQEHSNCIHF